jgi:hypothetical protein
MDTNNIFFVFGANISCYNSKCSCIIGCVGTIMTMIIWCYMDMYRTHCYPDTQLCRVDTICKYSLCIGSIMGILWYCLQKNCSRCASTRTNTTNNCTCINHYFLYCMTLSKKTNKLPWSCWHYIITLIN